MVCMTMFPALCLQDVNVRCTGIENLWVVSALDFVRTEVAEDVKLTYSTHHSGSLNAKLSVRVGVAAERGDNGLCVLMTLRAGCSIFCPLRRIHCLNVLQSAANAFELNGRHVTHFGLCLAENPNGSA